MDEGRLGAIRRQQNFHRKNMVVMNDIINYQQSVYSCYLNKERQTREAKLKAEEVYLKKSIVRNNFLLQCMEARKQKIAEKNPDKLNLGRYGGRPINAFSKDVDARVEWTHPRLRRLRKVERLKQKLGASIDFPTMQKKIDAIMSKSDKPDMLDSETLKEMNGQSSKQPTKNFRLKGASNSESGLLKNSLGVFSVFNSGFALGGVEAVDAEQSNENGESETRHGGHDVLVNDNTNDIEKTSRDDNLEKNTSTDDVGDISKNHTTCNESDDDKDKKTPPPLIRRPTLVLPPIKTTKEMKMHGFNGL